MTVRKIRIGNTISFPWQITRGGEIEDLSVVTNMKLMRYIGKIGREGIEVPVSLIDSNTLRVVAPTDTTNKLGDYIYELTYYRTGASVPPAERECALDITAFTLVSRTAYADPDDEFTLTSDLIIGLIGAKFESKDFTSEEWVEIQRPAIEAAQLASEAATRAVVATEEAVGVVFTIVESVLPAMAASKQGAGDAAGSATDAAAEANTQAEYAKTQGDRLAEYELIASEEVNDIEYNDITF